MRGRPRHHARGRHRAGRRPVEGQPARPRRAGHRPLGDHRRLRPAGRLRAQRRLRVQPQQGALPVPALGPGRLRRVQGRPARHRDRAPGQHRAPRARGDDPERAGLPRHARRHRLAHHDGQRPRRARLGRRRHRGRGRDARPARVDAHPQGRRVQADRRDPAGRDRHRRRAHDHRDAAPAGRGGQVRRVLRRGRRRGAAGQPGHDRQHEPGVRLHRRDLPDRRRDHPLPEADRPPGRPDRARRGLRQGAGPLARPGPRAGLLRDPRAGPVDGRPVDRRAQAPAGPHRALVGQAGVPVRARRLRRHAGPERDAGRRRLDPTPVRRRVRRGDLPGQRPGRARRPVRGRGPAPGGLLRRRGRRRPREQARRPSPSPTARRSSWTTAPS